MQREPNPYMPADIEKGRSLWQDAFSRLKKNRLALAGLTLLVVMVLLALLTPWIAPYSYEAQDLSLGATPPSSDHWMGTDIFGRDQLTRILYGSRVSLMGPKTLGATCRSIT